jgi:hypothetical protein
MGRERQLLKKADVTAVISFPNWAIFLPREATDRFNLLSSQSSGIAKIVV